MMSFVSFESFHQEILYKLFSVLVSSLSHRQNEMSLKKRASFNNLSINSLWALSGWNGRLATALPHSLLPAWSFPEARFCMLKPTFEFSERGRQHHCENQQIKLSGESLYSGSPHCIPNNERYRHLLLINISV